MLRISNYWPILAAWTAFASLVHVAGQAQTTDRPATSPSAAQANGRGENGFDAYRVKVEQFQQQAPMLEEQLNAASDLEPDVRTKTQDALRRAREQIDRIQTALTDSEDFAQRAAAVQSDSEQLTADIADLRDRPEPAAPDEALLSELERLLNEKQRDLDSLQEQQRAPDDPQERAARRKTLREQLVSIPRDIESTTELLSAPPPANEPAVSSQVNRFEALCRQAALEVQLYSVRYELALYDAEDAHDVARLRREYQRSAIAYLTREITVLSKEIAERRREDAEERVRGAEAALDRAPPLVQPIITGPLFIDGRNYEGSLELARDEVGIRGERQRYVRQLEAAEAELAEVVRWHQQAKDRIVRLGPTLALGLRLRQQRALLPNVDAITRRRMNRLATIENAQTRFVDYAEQVDDWLDTDAMVTAALMTDAAPRSEERREEIRSDVRAAIEQRQEFLGEIVDAYREFTETLDALDQAEQQLVIEVEGFTDFIDERILWIRSHHPLSLDSLRGDKLTVLWLLEAGIFQDVSASVVADAVENPFYWVLAGLLIAAMLLRARRLRRFLRHQGLVAQGRGTTSMKPTLQTWLVTVLISIPWPGLVLFLAWRLNRAPGDSNTVLLFADGLAQLGVVFFALDFFRQTCRSVGLAEAHFEWPDRTILMLRRTLRGLIVFAMPAALVVTMLHAHEADSGSETDAIEMVAFVITMSILLVLAHRLFKPGTGIFQDWIAYNQGGWIDRGQHLIYLVVIAIPIYLIVQTVFGYYYTAQQILAKSQLTVWLLLSAVFLRAMLTRTLTLRRRRLAIEQLRQRHAAVQNVSGEEVTSNLPEVAAETASDLGQVSRQTLKVINTTLFVLTFAGIWLVWNDVLPALNYLDNWELWKSTTTVVEETTGPDETVVYVERTISESISIVDLVAALLIGILTVTATRNVPGLLEITLLERLPLDPSVRYATNAMTRYAIILLGVILASRTLGIGWAQVQWLAAALTFGLAFGLQEIFANFVSGIIMLFEQPVRVGDVVTLDTVSGVVSRIRMRSTTITDWDRKEYIVPNKEFITGRLLNWTLSDTTNRVIINVGVAYSSDTNKVRNIISSVAAQHSVVLEDPAPIVTFESFGDSSLNFVLRAYLPNLDNRLMTISDLHGTIFNELSQAGIEIPFPQRDLHIRSTPAGREGDMGLDSPPWEDR